jgi:DNA-binding transcriptional regulator YdaS (Cro superfamily)
MRKAQQILGSREKLAKRIGVEPHLVAEWITQISDAPEDAVHAAVEVLLEYRKP